MWHPKQRRPRFLSPDAQSGEWYQIILCSLRPQRSCGKVMFLHLSVILFMCGGDLCPGRVSVQGVSVQQGGSLSGRQAVQLRAGGTHPTGIHSCCSMK